MGSISSPPLHSGPSACTIRTKSQIKINEKALPFFTLKNYIFIYFQLFLPELSQG